MNPERYYTLAKITLVIPLLTGLITIVEQFLPLQKVATVIENKRVSERERFGSKTYSIDFAGNNDQFTEAIYNQVNEGDAVALEVMYFSKEVKTIQRAEGPVWANDTNEVYFQLGMALVFTAASVYFLRRRYYTNKNYRYIALLCIISLVGLIRIINLNI